jgi:23S rRNA (pseudouridine1915-N3)-methyltransferase
MTRNTDTFLYTSKAPLDQLSHEAERVMKHLDASDYVVLMDERGEALSSEQVRVLGLGTQINRLPVFPHKTEDWHFSVPIAQLSKLIADAGNTHNAISFVIGGPFGHGEPVIARADRKLKLSAFVMNHQVARLVLLEQMYRAWTILKGEPYHH